MKDALASSDVPIIVELDWTESIVHPDERRPPLPPSMATHCITTAPYPVCTLLTP